MDEREDKKQRRRKKQRPAEIIAAGFEEFSEKGFDAARLEDVATRAGVAKGTIYIYFDSKEALFEAAVRSKAALILEQTHNVIASHSGTTMELLKKVFTAMYQRARDRNIQTIIKIIISEGDRFPEIRKFYYKEFVEKTHKTLESVVAQGVARGEFRKSAVTDLPIVIFAPGIMAMLWQMTFSSYKAIEPEEFLEAHIEMATRALCAP